jgi:TfoX/Sxy family transcriptional regulator of competence genes
MSTGPAFADRVLDQVRGAGGVAIRRMIGEYGPYGDGKVVALVCGNQVFLKPLAEAAALLDTPAWGPPYPGARPHLLPPDARDDPDLMARLARILAAILPQPKPKKSRASRKG